MSGTLCEQNRKPYDDLPNQEKNQYWTVYFSPLSIFLLGVKSIAILLLPILQIFNLLGWVIKFFRFLTGTSINESDIQHDFGVTFERCEQKPIDDLFNDEKNQNWMVKWWKVRLFKGLRTVLKRQNLQSEVKHMASLITRQRTTVKAEKYCFWGKLSVGIRNS